MQETEKYGPHNNFNLPTLYILHVLSLDTERLSTKLEHKKDTYINSSNSHIAYHVYFYFQEHISLFTRIFSLI